MASSFLKKLAGLSPSEFENLTYDLAQANGLQNLIWRTPGADGGRDIEGYSQVIDLTGHQTQMRWHIECKRYSSSIDWPTIWQKISYADALKADYLLLCTNNNPSPNCETHITEWNLCKRRPAIRVWRGYDLERILSYHPIIAASYGLKDSIVAAEAGSLPLSSIINHLIQTAYVGMALNYTTLSAVESASALSELLEYRLNQIRKYGRFLYNNDIKELELFEWVRGGGQKTRIDELGLRALVSFIRHCSSSDYVDITFQNNQSTIELINPRWNFGKKSIDDINIISFWSGVETIGLNYDAKSITIKQREEGHG